MSDRTGAKAVYVMDAQGEHVRKLAAGDEPSWSSDGRSIAFTRETNPPDIWVVNAAGGGLRNITRSRFAEFTPAWAPAKRR